jgi:hypothetical protein
LDNPTYTSITRLKKETLVNYRCVLCFVRNSTKDEELDLLSLYWIPNLHKWPYKQSYILGSDKYFTKLLSKLLTYILSVIELPLPNFLIKQSMQCVLQTKTILLRALSAFVLTVQYYLIFKWWLVLSALFNRTILHIWQLLEWCLYNCTNVACLVIYEGWNFTHM